MAETLQRLKQNQQVYDIKMQQYQDAQKPIAIETVLQGMPGGLNTPMAIFARKYGESIGLVGPNGTIRKADIPKFQQALVNNPFAMNQLNQLTIDYWREGVKDLNNLLLKNPNDTKTQLKLKEAHDQLNRALYRDEYTRKQLAEQAAKEQALQQQKQQQALLMLKHKNKMEEIRAGKPYSATKHGFEESQKNANERAKMRTGNKKSKMTDIEFFRSDPEGWKKYHLQKNKWKKGGPEDKAISALINNPTFWYLPDAEQERRINGIVGMFEKKKTKPQSPAPKRQKAIQILKDKGYPVTEANIKYVMGQMK